MRKSLFRAMASWSTGGFRLWFPFVVFHDLIVELRKARPLALSRRVRPCLNGEKPADFTAGYSSLERNLLATTYIAPTSPRSGDLAPIPRVRVGVVRPWPVRGLAVSVLCPPCSQAHCSQDPCSRAPSSAPFAAVAATQSRANDWKQTIKHPLLPPLSSPSFTDARAATRSRARDRHQRSRGRRTFAFPGTSAWPHPDSCQSHGGRTRLPSRGRCTRAPILKWPRS